MNMMGGETAHEFVALTEMLHCCPGVRPPQVTLFSVVFILWRQLPQSVVATLYVYSRSKHLSIG